MLTKKFYSVKDPVTQVTTKDIGWVLQYTGYQTIYETINNIVTCVKVTIIPVNLSVKPRYDRSASELDETTYNAASTDGESQQITAIRTKNLASFAQLQSVDYDNPATQMASIPGFTEQLAIAQAELSKAA